MRIFFGSGCRGAEAGWWTAGNLPDPGSQTMQVSIADTNGDGAPDLAYSSDQGIIVTLNGGDGQFSARLGAGLPQDGAYAGCCLHDWDGDGDLDLACTSFQGEGIRFFENRGGE